MTARTESSSGPRFVAPPPHPKGWSQLPANDCGRHRSQLEKALLILGVFEASRDELTITDLVRATGIPKSTVHRIVKTMEEWGAIERSRSRFHIGSRLFELGTLVPYRHLREVAIPFMEDLYEVTHQVVHLAILDGCDVLYIEKISGHRRVQAPSRVGGRMPAHCTAVGKVMLAFLPSRAEVLRDLGEYLPRRTKRSIASIDKLGRELDDAVAQGVAFDNEEAEPGVECVAGPVFDYLRYPIAALSVMVAAGTVPLERLAPIVRTAAMGLSRAIANAPLARHSNPLDTG